jgi:hypothetical protein
MLSAADSASSDGVNPSVVGRSDALLVSLGSMGVPLLANVGALGALQQFQ